MRWLFALATPFVGHPLRALVVAAMALLLGGKALWRPSRSIRRRSAWPLLALGVSWLLFSVGEAEALRTRANIRVDLLLTWPTLCLISVVCLVFAIRRSSARPPDSPESLIAVAPNQATSVVKRMDE